MLFLNIAVLERIQVHMGMRWEGFGHGTQNTTVITMTTDTFQPSFKAIATFLQWLCGIRVGENANLPSRNSMLHLL